MSGPGGRQTKVVKHELEQLVLDARRNGRSTRQIQEACNTNLKRRGVKDTLTVKAVERYLATLDRASVAPAHHPQVARENARLAVDVAGRLNLLDDVIGGWLDEARDAKKPTVCGTGDSAYIEWTPDWQARTSVARELRETAKTVVDLLERVHNVARIEAFQDAVTQVIREADPEVAKKLVEALRSHHGARQAALLGLGG